MISTYLTELVNELRQSQNLDDYNTDYAIAHDALHSLTGLGTTKADEAVLNALTNFIITGDCHKDYKVRVRSMLRLIASHKHLSEIIAILRDDKGFVLTALD